MYKPHGQMCTMKSWCTHSKSQHPLAVVSSKKSNRSTDKGHISTSLGTGYGIEFLCQGKMPYWLVVTPGLIKCSQVKSMLGLQEA